MIESLSRRELEVLQLVALGASNVQLADTLGLSIHTVKKHLARLLLKLKVESRSEAARRYRDSISSRLAAPAAAAPPAKAKPFDVLTTREWDVLARIASGANNQRIASDLALSLNTVKRHTTSIYSKLGVRSRVRAAALLHASTNALP
ncbi:MAG TPA: LuxR C-terminal-related transcriptional regulator [Ramlibacter sp.]